MKYVSLGLIMTAGVAISAALANGYSQLTQTESEAHALSATPATLQARPLSKINSSTGEKFNSISEQSVLNDQQWNRTNLTFSAVKQNKVANPATEADQFTSLQDGPQRWVLLKYSQSSGLHLHVQMQARLETIPVANVGDTSRDLLPAVYQFTHSPSNAAEKTDADITAERYKF